MELSLIWGHPTVHAVMLLLAVVRFVAARGDFPASTTIASLIAAAVKIPPYDPIRSQQPPVTYFNYLRGFPP